MAAAMLAPWHGGQVERLHRLVRRVVDVQRDELAALLLAFSYFFVLLASFAVLRPVRDAMAIASGLKSLPWLWTGTFVSMLVVVPIYGLLTRRVARGVFIPVAYRAFALMTLGFYALLQTRTEVVATASAFYVWVSVYNVFVVSVFWSFMADLFRNDQARRLFGFISAGGTLGMIAGPSATIWIAGRLGAAPLLLLTAVLLELAVWLARALDRRGGGERGEHADARSRAA
jgi:ATP:ADP antiporter, AAA family